jgi:aminoglycoside 6'-N-acetyltransferase
MSAIDAAVVSLEPFDVSSDLPRLAAWLREPHVLPWWPDTDAQLEEARARPSGAGQVLIAAWGEPIGYMRWQRSDPAALASLGLDGIPPGAVDMDILIGDPLRTRRGVGRRAVRLLRDRLLADSSVSLVGMVSAVGNEIALRSFRAAGFEPYREYDDPRYGRCLVLLARRPVGAPDQGSARGARRNHSSAGEV